MKAVGIVFKASVMAPTWSVNLSWRQPLDMTGQFKISTRGQGPDLVLLHGWAMLTPFISQEEKFLQIVRRLLHAERLA